MLNAFKPEKANWKHYFGGFGFIIIILQLLTGLFLIFFYEPTLGNAYKSIQYISNQLFMGSLVRNLHRWISALLFIAIIVHTVRCFLRSDFNNRRKRVLWLTGVLLLLPIFLFIVTGLIIPWEWKGYFFMAMIPNYFEPLPYVGPALKEFFNESFTIPRYYVFHIVVLPLISIVLIDYHIISKVRKRGIFRYLLKHSVATLPLIILLFVLAQKIPIPSNDPVEIPMPLEGAWVLTPEWYFMTVLLPLGYLKGILVPLLSIVLPLFLFFAVAFMPYYLKGHEKGEEEEEHSHEHHRRHHNAIVRFWHRINRTSLKRKVVNGIIVTIISLFLSGLLLWGNYNSPTLGCNSCHNTDRGIRMGIPPEFFKDRSKLPHLNENDWMVKHWYYPNEVW
jgi:menaquinol-cytochrome c reductase cytochrome b subunit